MKLMTEMQDGCVHAFSWCVDSKNISSAEVHRLEHDAAAAHALKRAITLELSMPHLMAVEAKADELMREWGFEPEAGK